MPWMSVIGRGEAPWPGADASMDEAGAARPRGGRPAAACAGACRPAAARVGVGRSAAARIGGEAASHSDGRASGRVQA